MTASRRIDLPEGYRTQDIIAYHLRDPAQSSEKWLDGVLYKGLSVQGQPACLTLHFAADHVEAHLDVQDNHNPPVVLTALVRRMLGLDQDIDTFEKTIKDHPRLGPLVQRQSGLRVPVAATPFEALTWAIIGQQISVQAAVSIRHRVVRAAGRPHPSGLWCHPDAHAFTTLSIDDLRAAGLSRAKAHTMHAVSEALIQDDLIWVDNLDAQSARAIYDRLVGIRGIGPWTADYTLLRGYGWLDGSLHGDVAVRRALTTLLEHDEALSQEYVRDWLSSFSPWRALVAAHLWASRNLQA